MVVLDATTAVVKAFFSRAFARDAATSSGIWVPREKAWRRVGEGEGVGGGEGKKVETRRARGRVRRKVSA